MTTGIAGGRRKQSFMLLWWEHQRRKRHPWQRRIFLTGETGDHSTPEALCRDYRVPSFRAGSSLETPD